MQGEDAINNFVLIWHEGHRSTSLNLKGKQWRPRKEYSWSLHGAHGLSNGHRGKKKDAGEGEGGVPGPQRTTSSTRWMEIHGDVGAPLALHEALQASTPRLLSE